MRQPKPLHPAVPAVMRLIAAGKITLKEASEVLDCSIKTVKNKMDEMDIEVVTLGTVQSRKEKSEANKLRNELLETLAKKVKYEKEDINLLAYAHNIPSRTLYRWIHKV